MPTMHRPWTTQYGQDYNKLKSKHLLYKKKSQPVRMLRPSVPMATSTYLPRPPPDRTYTGPVHGLDDTCNIDDTDVTTENPVPQVQFCDVPHDLSAAYSAPLDEDRPLTPPPSPSRHHISPFPAPTYIDADPVIPEPIEIGAKSPDLHWICWPEPKKSTRRPHTSQGLKRPTTPQVTSRATENKHAGVPVTYQPKLYSWTNATNENERKAVEAMFELRRSHSFYEPSRKPMTSISINDPLPRDTYTGYGGAQNLDPRSIYQQSYLPYNQSGGPGSSQYGAMQMYREGQQATPFNYSVSFNKYPLHMRKVVRRTLPATDDYVHDQSMFMTTTPACVGHFIIHPDWVSERTSLRRSNSMILPTTRKASKDGLRY